MHAMKVTSVHRSGETDRVDMRSVPISVPSIVTRRLGVPRRLVFPAARSCSLVRGHDEGCVIIGA